MDHILAASHALTFQVAGSQIEHGDNVFTIPISSNAEVEAWDTVRQFLIIATILITVIFISLLLRDIYRWRAVAPGKKQWSWTRFSALLVQIGLIFACAFQLATCDKIDVLRLCFYSFSLAAAVSASVATIAQKSRGVSSIIISADLILGLLVVGDILFLHDFTPETYTLACLYISPLLLGLVDASTFRPGNPEDFPVDFAPLITRITFGWMSPLLKAIQHRAMIESDLTTLGESWKAVTLSAKFSEISKPGQALQVSLLVRQHWKYLVIASLLQAVSSSITFCVPWLLRDLLLTQSPSTFVTMFGLILLSAITSNHASYFFNVVGMRIKATVITRIYDKILTTAPNSTSLGNVSTLIDVDSQRFVSIMPLVHLFWTLPIQVIVVIASLIFILGPVSILGVLAIFVIIIPLLGITSSKVRYWVGVRMKQTDARMELISEMLGNIKSIKLQAWTTAFLDRLQIIRGAEVDMLGRRAVFNSLGAASMVGSIGCMTAGTLLMKFLTKGRLSSDVIFPSLMFFSLLSMPLGMLNVLVMEVQGMGISLKRINDFLLSPERVTYVNSSDSRGEEDDIAALMTEVFLSAGLYSDDKKTILSNINFSVAKGQFVTIAGQVGSGKTSLLLGFLEDLTLEHGDVFLKGRASYVSQTSWLMDSTIRDNILCGLPFDPVHYENTLRCCALLDDIRRLPMGDQTNVGQRGVALSGGQKSRLSIARAAYSNADVYLMDDPLAALDSHVIEFIMREMFGPTGIFSNKTIIMATNSLPALRAANSVFLVSDGTLTQGGSWESITGSADCELKNYLMKLVAATSSEGAKSTQQLSDYRSTAIQPAKSLNTASEILIAEDMAIHAALELNNEGTPIIGKDDIRVVESEALSMIESITDLESLRELVGAEVKSTRVQSSAEQEEGVVNSHVYNVWIRSMTIGGLAVTFVPLLCIEFFGISSTYSLKVLSSSAPSLSVRILVAMASFSALQGVSFFAFLGTLYYFCILPAARAMHRQLAEAVFHSRLSFFETTPLGHIMTRFSNDIGRLDSSLSNTMANLLFILPKILVTLIIILIVAPLAIIFILPMVFLYYIIQSYFLHYTRTIKRFDNHTRSAISTNFQETITGCTTIRTAGLTAFFQLKNFDKVDINMGASLPALSLDSWLGIRLDCLGVGLQIASAGLLLATKPSPATLGFAMNYILQIPGLFGAFVKFRAVFESDMISLERLLSYENNEAEGFVHGRVNVEDQTEPSWPQQGRIRFEAFSMRHRDGLPLCLTGIDLDIPAGSKIGIVGRTGAGKTSIALALLRVCEAAEGTIKIDDIDISSVPLQTLRQRVVIIPQDCPAFRGTLRSNLDPLGTSSVSELQKVIEATFLDKFFPSSSWKEILEMELGGENSNLSSGQLQLVAIARAMLSNAKVIILDEVTAAIDPETDAQIRKSLERVFQGRTVITIAHRISSVLSSDRILVLENGVVAEFASPQALIIGNPDSLFMSLVEQAGIKKAAQRMFA